MKQRHVWMVSLALLAACGAQQESAQPTSQTPTPQTETTNAPAATTAAQSTAAQPARPLAAGRPMQGQSAQDVRAEAPASSRADIARATTLPAMTQPKPGPTNKSAPVHPAASKPAPASPTAKAAAHHATPTQQAASETTKAASTTAAAVAADFNVKPCKSCHAVNKTRVGPAWKDVAAAYGAPEELARAFKAGFKVSDRKLASADPKWKRKATLMTGTFKRLIRGHEDAAAQALFAAVKRGHI